MSSARDERDGATRRPPQTTREPAKVNAEGPPPTVTLQRRRDAALRLPPLEDGFRDPLDKLAGVPVPRQSEEIDVVTLGLCCTHGEDCPARQSAP